MYICIIHTHASRTHIDIHAYIQDAQFPICNHDCMYVCMYVPFHSAIMIVCMHACMYVCMHFSNGKLP